MGGLLIATAALARHSEFFRGVALAAPPAIQGTQIGQGVAPDERSVACGVLPHSESAHNSGSACTGDAGRSASKPKRRTNESDIGLTCFGFCPLLLPELGCPA